MSNTRALETSNQAVLPVSISGTLASYVSNSSPRFLGGVAQCTGMRESIIGRCFANRLGPVSAASRNVSSM
jgi:hypothetical protein